MWEGGRLCPLGADALRNSARQPSSSAWPQPSPTHPATTLPALDTRRAPSRSVLLPGGWPFPEARSVPRESASDPAALAATSVPFLVGEGASYFTKGSPCHAHGEACNWGPPGGVRTPTPALSPHEASGEMLRLSAPGFLAGEGVAVPPPGRVLSVPVSALMQCRSADGTLHRVGKSAPDTPSDAGDQDEPGAGSLAFHWWQEALWMRTRRNLSCRDRPGSVSVVRWRCQLYVLKRSLDRQTQTETQAQMPWAAHACAHTGRWALLRTVAGRHQCPPDEGQRATKTLLKTAAAPPPPTRRWTLRKRWASLGRWGRLAGHRGRPPRAGRGPRSHPVLPSASSLGLAVCQLTARLLPHCSHFRGAPSPRSHFLGCRSIRGGDPHRPRGDGESSRSQRFLMQALQGQGTSV